MLPTIPPQDQSLLPTHSKNFPIPTMSEDLLQSSSQDYPNLTLRPITVSDVDDFMVWATDDRVSKFCVWDTYTSRDQGLDYLINHAIPHPWLRAICLNDRAVGSITVTPAGPGTDSCRAELGYVLAHEYWGKGIMTRAVAMAVDAVVREDWPGLRRLEAVVAVENRGSQRVLEKAGFLRDGVLRQYRIKKGKAVDAVMYSLLVNQ